MATSKRPLPKRLWYGFLHIACRVFGVAVLRIRCVGRELVPRQGGALVLANHQSYFDPVLVGLACDRRLNYLARESLFRLAPFRLLIQSLDAIPIDREGLGLAGLKETLRRLKRDELVLMFPEGTRTLDGDVGPLRPGFCSLARRARAPLVPAGLDGAFAAWPRGRTYPLPERIAIVFGDPLLPEEIERLSDDELLAEVERRLRLAHARARLFCRQPTGIELPANAPSPLKIAG